MINFSSLKKNLTTFVRKTVGKATSAFSSEGALKLAENHQPYGLRAYMQHARMRHDEKALVDVQRVRVEDASILGKGFLLYFCPMEGIEVKARLKKGDSKELPYEVALIDVPSPEEAGYFNLKNVILHSNGKITLTSTPETEWEKLHKYDH